MPYPHTIRLRGPWECEPVARYATEGEETRERVDGLPAPSRPTLPAPWDSLFGPEFIGRLRLRRRFNLPTGLEAHERVWLVIEGMDLPGTASLNDEPLGSLPEGSSPTDFDVTLLLRPRNELVLEIDRRSASRPPSLSASTPALVADARLEIRLA
jgi:beta-galactosidase/beta-glucuronidase